MSVAAVGKKSARSPELSSDRDTVVRNPKRQHIPLDSDKPRAALGFPWVCVGDRLLLAMLKGEDRVTESGIVMPDLPGRNKALEICMGMVVTMGPGDFVDGNFVSIEHDYGILPGDVLYIWPNAGQVVTVENCEFRAVSPPDIVMRMNRELGKALRDKIMDMVQDVIRKSIADPDNAGYTKARNPMPKIPERLPFEVEQGEARERMASAHGVRTKTQFLAKE